jgi:hypothetical protein
MKNRILILVAIVSLVAMSSCQKNWESFNKNFQTGKRSYHVEQYSGGKLIATYDFVGIINDSQGSDGYYFHKGDSLIEISGDLIIKSVD